jgi:hypothetical protein
VGVDEDANWFLILVGLGLIGVAIVGLFKREESALSGSFLFLGVATVLIGAFDARIEGDFELSSKGLRTRILGKIRKRALAVDRHLDAAISLDQILKGGG